MQARMSAREALSMPASREQSHGPAVGRLQIKKVNGGIVQDGNHCITAITTHMSTCLLLHGLLVANNQLWKEGA